MIVSDVIESKKNFNLTADNFNLAFLLESQDEEYKKNPRAYFRVVLLYEEGVYDYDAQSQKILDFVETEAKTCNQDTFPLTEKEKLVYNTSEMFCFDQSRKEAFINGRWISLNNQNIAMTVRSCRVVATEEEI